LDLFAICIDVISLLSLLVAGIVGLRAVRAFRQSRQAVTESASLISVIVDALTSRIQRSESVLTTLRSEVAAETRRSDILEGNQSALRASHEEIVHQLQDVLSTDKKLILELEHLRSTIGEVPRARQAIDGLPKPGNLAAMISEADVLASLTPTERSTLEILRAEGAKGAPELGKRLKKSREHTSRLMKKLYMEGYVSRESNRAPFRYRLNDVVRSALESAPGPIMEEEPERP
jgi:hypothetical protein